MTQPNINGVTVKDITRLMHGHERMINWYNKKYSFKIDQATVKDQKKYADLLAGWDNLKSKRDQLMTS